MIDFKSFGIANELSLGDFKNKTSAIAGQQMEASAVLCSSADGKFSAGIWECTPGRFTTVRDASAETCHILRGRVTIHNPDGSSQEFSAGETFNLPLGWQGEWTVHETVRKIYILS